MNDRIDFFCVRAEHQGSEPDDALTMHDDCWAYCAAAAREPHEWQALPAGGLSLDDTKQFVRRHRINPVATTGPRSD